jgi:hypothetical protein
MMTAAALLASPRPLGLTTVSLADTSARSTPAQSPVDRFGFAVCADADGKEPGDCFSSDSIPANDGIAEVESCARERPCEFAAECETKLSATSASASRTRKLDDLRREAAKRCNAVAALQKSAEKPASPPPTPPLPARPPVRRSVVAVGTYYASLEWLADSNDPSAKSGAAARCPSGRISLTVTPDYKAVWTIGAADKGSTWTAQVDPATGSLRSTPGTLQVATAGQATVPLPGEVEIDGSFSQFTIRFAPCGRGRITVRNLARTDAIAPGRRQ